MNAVLSAPFPWFGGKRRIAPLVWARFGNVGHYVEPFAGSLAVLLARPAEHLPAVETVNDIDRYLANFWRALQAAPDEVARYADWPVNECDLTARHLWLINEGRARLERMEGDPEFYDARIAGWWVWGLCAWIGGGWCSGEGPWVKGADGRLVRREKGEAGVSRRRVHLGDPGRGINRQLVHLGAAGQGINRQRVYLSRSQGVTAEAVSSDIRGYMRALADRLRRVRVCCGDWGRVVTEGALSHGSTVGVLLDPPYSHEVGRDNGIYACELSASAEVRRWAIEHGGNPRYRIALCGYEGEYDMPPTWEKVGWKAGACYKRRATVDNGNRFRERVWFSPHCLKPAGGNGHSAPPSLFEVRPGAPL